MSGLAASRRAFAALLVVLAMPQIARAQVIPLPTITALSPSAYEPGKGGFKLTVFGTGFVQSYSWIFWNDQRKTTQVVSSTQVTTVLTDAETRVTSARVMVLNEYGGGSGGGRSNYVSMTIGPSVITGTTSVSIVPVPGIASISPHSVRAWDPPFTLGVTGSWFTRQSKIHINGAERTTAFVSSTQLTTAITAADLAGVRSHEVKVFTPAPGGGTSPGTLFHVSIPVPIVTSLSPASVKGGSDAFTLSVNGSKFIPSTVVYFNGTERPTTYVSDTKLTINVTKEDVARVTPPVDRTVTAGVYTKGGGRLQPITFTITKQ